MKAVKSNINKTSCNPISSNCVDWEGGDLDIIQICENDSVSDIIKKADTLINQLKIELDLSDVDLSELWGKCVVCPNPKQTLHNVIKLLVDQIKTLNKGNTGTSTTTLPTVDVNICIRETSLRDIS